MIILDQIQTLERKEEIISAIKRGDIFIYPTDTIYGIGCDATNEKSVEKIRELKKRDKKPFSVIVPNKEWITSNLVVTDSSKIDLLPGPYTLIMKTKNKNIVASNISFSDILGVRIPKNFFSEILEETNVPFVTTSVNISGQKHMDKIEDVPDEILNNVDYVIYNGPIFGESSAKIDLTK